MEFCSKNDWCGRPNQHQGACNGSPGATTRAFDFDRDAVKAKHELAAVMGGVDATGMQMAPVIPEFLPKRFGGPL